jgi:hypothetical protein
MSRSRKGRAPTFNELEAFWYAKLESAGFRDAEDTSSPERPLKEWHSRKFIGDRARIRQAERERYDQKLAALLNGPEVMEICRLIADHGNKSIGPKRVQRIIEEHRAGLSERAIAKKVRCGRKCVAKTIAKTRQWMKLAA